MKEMIFIIIFVFLNIHILSSNQFNNSRIILFINKTKIQELSFNFDKKEFGLSGIFTSVFSSIAILGGIIDLGTISDKIF